MEGPLPCNTFYPHSSQGTRTQQLDSGVKLWKKTEEDTQYTCEPLGDLRYLFRTTNECHSNEHPQNLVSVDKISQDNSQHSLTETVLQNGQEIDLLIPEQGGT